MGDRIETGDADKAEIVFKDGTTLRLGFNTTLEIPNPKSQIRNPKSPLSRPSEINLLRGQVWTKVQKSTNAPQYAIRTEAATAVARGTEFGVKIQRAASTNSSAPITVLTVKEGAVDFSNALGLVQATAMTESTATSDSAPSQPILLKTIKQFDVAPYKRVTVEAQPSVFDLDEFMFRMVYPQGWAGIYIRSIPDEKDAAVRQLRIVRVWSGSPAEQAGLAVGDVITQVNGQPVTKPQEILRPIFQQQGASVTLSLSRNGLSKTVSLVTTNHPYAVPTSEMAADLARDLVAATWPLIEARCQGEASVNQWPDLEHQFRNVLDRHPGAAAVHNNLGVWYQMNQEVGPAIQQLQQAIASDPNNPLYHYNLSRVLVSIGNFERCAEEAEAVVKLVPDWVPGIVQIAEAYLFLGRRDDALAALEHRLGANASSAVLWRVKAYVLLSTQRLDEALAAALRAAELEPSHAANFMTLASVYWARGQQQESEAASRKAIELDPGNAAAYDNLAVDIIFRLGNRLPEDPTDGLPEDFAIERWRDRPAEELAIIAEAERMSRKAIELNPNFVGAHVSLGNILLLRGAVDEAEPILRKAAELDPNGRAADAFNNLAYHFAGWGIRLDEALQFAQHAVQLAPEGWVFDTLAMVHFRRGEWEKAEAAWKKCIELAGPQGDSGAWYHLGKLYERNNAPDAAITAYLEALRLRPDYPEALRALEKLRR
ncbi:MAG: tetratricopeptide repeat protein [Verrucomicrobia bacterium]|nr:tetratricopeptide repeat protein [Verrucomicrobiota bacterium]